METAKSSRLSWQTLFAPSVFLMERLRYAYKFILIGLLVLLPFGFVFQSQYSIATERIEFNGKEVDGVDYVIPVRDLLRLVQRQRVVSVAAFSGDAAYRNLTAQGVADIERAIAGVDGVEMRKGIYTGHAQLGVVMQTTKRWNEAKAAWNSAKGARSPDDAEKGYSEVASILNDIILNYAANYSNLILDPDLDSYWLMDAFVGKGPALADAIAAAATAGVRIPADPGAQADRLINLGGLYKTVSGTMSDLENVNMATTFKEVEKYSKLSTTVPNIKPQLAETKGLVFDSAETIRRIYLSTPPGQKPPALGVNDHHVAVEATLRAIDGTFKLHEKVTPELRTMAKMRADKYTSQRFAAVLATVIAAFVLAFLFIGFFISVRRSVTALDGATRRMIAGTDERFAISARDEIGDIANAYNQINAALTEARRLKDSVERDNMSLQQDIVGLLDVVANASDGDLSIRAKVTEGALGNVADAFNLLLESLQKVLGEVIDQIDRTNQSVAQIRTVSRAVETGASTQASEVTSATKVIEQISVETERVSTNAVRAADAAKRTEQSAVEGAMVVESVIDGMGRIRETAQAGAKKVKTLGDRSMEITGIVSTISRISEQTNMLALNAAIEAARAGEFGRGFSVVAEEVRKLAERTATATQEIDRLVKAIIAETSETVEVIEQQAIVVEEQSQSVAKAGDSLTRIRQVSAESAALVAEITNVARAQVDGTTKVVSTVGQVSKIAVETQRSAKDTAVTIEQLIALQQQLAQSVQRFKLS